MAKARKKTTTRKSAPKEEQPALPTRQEVVYVVSGNSYQLIRDFLRKTTIEDGENAYAALLKATPEVRSSA